MLWSTKRIVSYTRISIFTQHLHILQRFYIARPGWNNSDFFAISSLSAKTLQHYTIWNSYDFFRNFFTFCKDFTALGYLEQFWIFRDFFTFCRDFTALGSLDKFRFMLHFLHEIFARLWNSNTTWNGSNKGAERCHMVWSASPTTIRFRLFSFDFALQFTVIV